MQSCHNQENNEAPIQKVVPVRKNGFVLELLVPPPGQANKSIQRQVERSTTSGNVNLAFQPPMALKQNAVNTMPNSHMQQQPITRQPVNGSPQSLRDLFKGR